MKKFKALLLLGCCLVWFTACGNSGTDSTESASATESVDSTESDYEFTYYGKDNPEVDYDIDECVTKLGDYKGINITTTAYEEITDDVVNQYIVDQLADYPIDTPIDRTTIKEDDYLRVTRDGEEDSELFSVADSGDDNIAILIKAKVGDTVTTTNTSDEDTTYTFTINSVVDYHSITDISELTDDYISENTGYDTAEEFITLSKNFLEGYNQNQISIDCINAVVENSEMIIPDELVTYYVNEDLADMDYYCFENGYDSLDTYLSYYGYTVDSYISELQDSYQTYLKQNFVCEAINKAENLEDNDTDYSLYKEVMYKLSGYTSEDEFMETVDNEDEFKEDYSNIFKPFLFIANNAKKITYSGTFLNTSEDDSNEE
jgi:hypothetical protein